MASWKIVAGELIEKMTDNQNHVVEFLSYLTDLPRKLPKNKFKGLKGLTLEETICEATEELIRLAPTVLKFLIAYTPDNYVTNNCLGSDIESQHQVFSCLSSWLNCDLLSTADVARSKLFVSMFYYLGTPTTPSPVYKSVCDCFCESLMLTRKDQDKNLELCQALFQGLHSVPEVRCFSMDDCGAVENSSDYCRVCTEFAKALIKIITDTPGQGFGDMRTVDLVLKCVSNHCWQGVANTFSFWHKLSKILQRKQNNDLNCIFKPYVERLIEALCRRCQLDSNCTGTPEESDVLAFRTEVVFIIRDVVFLVGAPNCFQQMFNSLKNQGTNSTWDMSEASLFIMSSVAKNIPEENDIVPQVIKAILHLPENTHIAVRYTSTRLIGEFHHWIEKHPEVLEPILNFLLSCLHQPPLATVAATSLRNISSTCSQQMGIHFQGLLRIVQVMDSFNISKTAAIGLLKGTALTLAKMPLNEISKGLTQLCQIQLTPLLEFLKSDGFSKDKKKIDPIVWLDRLTAIFKCMKSDAFDGQTHPCLTIIQEIWPVLRDISSKCQDDFRILDHFTHCVRDAVYCLGTQFSPLFEPLVKHTVLMYQINQYPCLLYLGSVLVDEFGKDVRCIQRLMEMLEAFCESIFPKFDGVNKLKRYPANVEELFALSTSFVLKAPVAFLQSTIFKSIFRCGLAACVLRSLCANTSVMKFFTALVSRNWEKVANNNEAGDFEQRVSLMQSVLGEHGRDLTCSLLYASFCHLPTALIQNVADVIYELMLFDRMAVCHWMESAIEALPSQNNGRYTIKASRKELTNFLDSMSRAQSGKTVNWCIMEVVRSRGMNTNSSDGRRNYTDWVDESSSSSSSSTLTSSSSSVCLSDILPSTSSAPSLWSSSSSIHLITE